MERLLFEVSSEGDHLEYNRGLDTTTSDGMRWAFAHGFPISESFGLPFYH